MQWLISMLVTRPILMYIVGGLLAILVVSNGITYALLKLSYSRNEVLQERLNICNQNVDTLIDNESRREDYMKDMYDVLKKHYDTLPTPPTPNMHIDDSTIDEYLGLRHTPESSYSPTNAPHTSPEKELHQDNTRSRENTKR